MISTVLRWLRPVTTMFVMLELINMKIRVYSALSMGKRAAAAARSATLNKRIVVPRRIENKLRNITERMSRPPPEPCDLSGCGSCTMVDPPKMAASILSLSGTLKFYIYRAFEYE